jgi:hypothetical protein
MKLRNIFKGGSFTVILVALFVIFAIVTFAYFQKTGMLADYKVNMFSSIGADKVVLETETPEMEDLSIGVIAPEVEKLSIGVTESEVEEIVPETMDTTPLSFGSIYTAKAKAGDSITTLSRDLAKRYIDENGLIVTKEQKIYIEDYIQNNVGDYVLQIGDEISVSSTLISQAVLNSQDLSEYQVDYFSNFVELIWDASF